MDHQECYTTSTDCGGQEQDASRHCDGESSQENSPILSSRSMVPISSPLTQLPDAVFSFFKDVARDGYPESEALAAKAQPWRNVWMGPKPLSDGRLMVALPRRTDFGSNGLGGY